VASTPKAVAEASDVIILMLAGPEAIDAVLEGSEGLMAGLQAGQTLVNMSTVSPQYSKQLAGKLTAKSAVAIDAPVSGSRKPAEEGALVILAGGPQDKVTELEPLLMCMGKKVVYCGDAGQGASMKMAVNLLLGIMAAGISEAVNLGQKSGLDTATMLETMLAGPMGCALFEFKKPMLIDDSFSAQFPLKHMTKDIRFAPMKTAPWRPSDTRYSSSTARAWGRVWPTRTLRPLKKFMNASVMLKKLKFRCFGIWCAIMSPARFHQFFREKNFENR
jgi:3-hydroxyisobutyrate dehydrogenase-like beta-hydroxyacid dehydrogenase